MTTKDKATVGLFCFLLAVSIPGEAKEPAPLPIEQMRAAVYTKDFAKRFALPDPEPGTEPSGGVQAMEFAVEDAKAKYPHKRFATYQCVLKLYLDEKLPIAYPEEGVAGDHRFLIQPTHFFLWPNPENKRWMSLSEKDRQYFNERNGRYTRSAALASDNYLWHKQGMFVDMFYEEYHRDIFPNLAYVRLDMGCPTVQWGERYPALQVWLKKQGAKDYRQQIRIDNDDFLKFSVPDSFFKRINVWIKEATRYNNTVMERKPNRDAGAPVPIE